ncbi:MAG: hypothetical protein IPG50_14050 [Myxococcales bacterium]|nr:hypothetical protein [Myxococcales bacterium]
MSDERRRGQHRVSVSIALAAAFALIGCARQAADATPEGAVHLWIERAEASLEDRRAAREAYALLGPVARANLEERALRASRGQGRRVEPHEMLAEGRFGLRFRPKTMSATFLGPDDAVVHVRGSGAEEHASVRCHRENGTSWRIEPGLPALSASPRRDDAGQ